jgi:hypothetical protein
MGVLRETDSEIENIPSFILLNAPRRLVTLRLRSGLWLTAPPSAPLVLRVKQQGRRQRLPSAIAAFSESHNRRQQKWWRL